MPTILHKIFDTHLPNRCKIGLSVESSIAYLFDFPGSWQIFISGRKTGYYVMPAIDLEIP